MASASGTDGRAWHEGVLRIGHDGALRLHVPQVYAHWRRVRFPLRPVWCLQECMQESTLGVHTRDASEALSLDGERAITPQSLESKASKLHFNRDVFLLPGVLQGSERGWKN